MDEPRTLTQIDRQLSDYRQILHTVSLASRPSIWDQIDSLLELRLKVGRRERREARETRRALNSV